MSHDAALRDLERTWIDQIQVQPTADWGVLVDDIVLRTWGNGRVGLVYRLLCGVIQQSGDEPSELALHPIAAAIADARPLDWPQLPFGS